jgi:hypothetical protein
MVELFEQEELYFCPIFQKEIDSGLCWEICYAGTLIKEESVKELSNYIENNAISLRKVHKKFCLSCKYCQWEEDKKKEMEKEK